jgi:hypothetical protein
MQLHGWQLAVEYEPYRRTYRILFKHEQLRLYALTAEEHIEGSASSFMNMNSLPIFHVCYAAASFEVLRLHDDLSNFRAIDATPTMVHTSVKRIEDLNVFNVSLRKAEEILVNEADMTVIEHLEAIKALQSEEQKIIRQRMLRGPQSGEVVTLTQQATTLATVISIAA